MSWNLRRDAARTLVLLAAIACQSSGAAAADTKRPDKGNSTEARLNQISAEEDVATQIARASRLLLSKETVAEGIRIYSDLAKQGNDDAKYTLGWVYIDGRVVAKDNDRAYAFLQQAGGKFRIAAMILIGAIHAEGSSKIAADKTQAQRIFDEATVALEAQLESFKAVEITSVEEVHRRQQWREDWIVLDGMATKYGLVAKRPAKK